MRNLRNYRLLVSIAFMQGFVFYGPIATLYRRAYGLDIQGLFLIESISWIVTILLEAPWGRFADRYGYRTTLLIGNMAFLASKVIFSGASGFSGFLLERLLLSVALSALSGCTEALLFRSVGTARAESAFGRWHAASGAGLFIASILSPLLYAPSMRATAHATIAPYGAAFLLSLFIVDVGEEEQASVPGSPGAEGGGLREAFGNLRVDTRLLGFLVVAAVSGEAAQAATVFLAPLQYERAGIPRAAFGILFASLQGAGFAAAGSAHVSAALGRKAAVRMLLVIECAGLAALSMTESAFMTMAALVAVAASAAMFRPLSTTIQNQRIASRNRATALSVNAMVMELVAAAVNVGVGRAAGIGLPVGFGVLCALLLVALPFSSRAIDADGARQTLR